ncbi:MAG: CPBP family intramembrane metalloprotease [Candidatus Latescibacteria bacterium]|nr:CPBP family intramembrane metalloprotease [Candidatus Latescibacterota bacterium]
MGYPNLKQSIWLLILFLLISAALGVPIAILGIIFDRSLHLSPYVLWLLTLASFVLVVVYAKRRTDRTWCNILLFNPVSWRLCLPLAVSIAGLWISISIVESLVRYLIPVPEILVKAFRDLPDIDTPFVLACYYLVVQTPLIEEVLFRGVILIGLLTHYNRNRAIIWSAILFALFHVNPWQLPVGFILGIVLASWVVQTGSLLPAIAGHALHNLLFLSVARWEIFGPAEDFNTVVFLPWWLTVCGIALATIGLLWFSRMVTREKAKLETLADQEPG